MLGDALPVFQLPVPDQAFSIEGERPFVVTLLPGYKSQIVERISGPALIAQLLVYGEAVLIECAGAVKFLLLPRHEGCGNNRGLRGHRGDNRTANCLSNSSGICYNEGNKPLIVAAEVLHTCS